MKSPISKMIDLTGDNVVYVPASAEIYLKYENLETDTDTFIVDHNGFSFTIHREKQEICPLLNKEQDKGIL